MLVTRPPKRVIFDRVSTLVTGSLHSRSLETVSSALSTASRRSLLFPVALVAPTCVLAALCSHSSALRCWAHVTWPRNGNEAAENRQQAGKTSLPSDLLQSIITL